VATASAQANIEAITFDPTTTGTLATTVIYAGTNGGGIITSSNGGSTWNQSNDPLTNFIVQGIATLGGAAPVYVATTGGVFVSASPCCVFTADNFGLSTVNVLAIVVDPADATGKTAYAATNGGGVFKTTDAGVSWTPFNTGLTNLVILSLALDHANNLLYAGTSGNGIQRTATATAGWSDYNAAGVTAGLAVQALALDSSTSSVFAGAITGVYKSSTAAASWTSFVNAAAGTGLTTSISVLSLAADGLGSIYAGTSGFGIFKSTSSTADWAAINFGLGNLFVPALAVDPGFKTTVLAGTDGDGIFISANGGQTWSPNASALTSAFVETVAVDPTTPAVYAGTGAAGIFKSTNSPTFSTWTAVNSGLNISTMGNVLDLAVDPTTVTTLYAATSAGGLFKSINAGASWFAANGSSATALPSLDDISVLVDLTHDVFVGTNGFGVYESSNGGSTWTAFNTGLSAAINAMALDNTNHVLYAATAGSGVCTTATGVANWTCTNTNLTGTALTVYSLALDPGIPTTVYAGTANGLFKSQGAGNWTQLISGVTVTAVTVNPTLHVFAATSAGLYMSTDGGTTWAPQTLFAAGVLDLACTPTTLTLTCNAGSAAFFAATTSGVFSTTNPGPALGNAATAALPAAAVVTQSGGGPDGANIPTVVSPSAGITYYTGPGVVIQSGTGAGAIMYAATAGGVFKSTNGGATWAAFNAGLPDAGVRALAVDTVNSNLYAATSTGIYQTPTAAAAWLPANFGLTTTDVLSLTISGTTIFAGTNGGGVFSNTLVAGVPNWSPFNSAGLTSLVVNQLGQVGGNVVFAGTPSGVFTTGTGPINWASFSSGLANTNVQALAVDTTAFAIYVGTSSGVYKSPTGAAAFVLFDSNPSTLTQLNVTSLAVGGGIGCGGVACVYAGTNGANGGIFTAPISAVTGTVARVWTAANTGLGNTVVQSLLVDTGTPVDVIAGTQGGGIFKTANSGGTWAVSNSGMGAGYASVIAVDPSTTGTAYAGILGAGVFKITGFGPGWTAPTVNQPADPFVQAVVTAGAATPRTTLYAGTKTLGIFRSLDAGNTWAQFAAGLPGNPPTATLPQSIQALVVDSAGNVWAGSSTTGAYKLVGATWTAVAGLGDVQALVADASGNIFAGTTSGVYECAACAAAGVTWASFSTGLTSLNVLSLALDGAGNIYAGTSGTAGTTLGGIFKSSTSAANFSAMNFGLSNLTVESLAVGGGNIYAGTQGGVFQSTNAGASWSLIESGISLVPTPTGAPATAAVTPSITAVAVDTIAPTNAYAGSSNGGVFKTANSGATWTPTTP